MAVWRLRRHSDGANGFWKPKTKKVQKVMRSHLAKRPRT